MNMVVAEKMVIRMEGA